MKNKYSIIISGAGPAGISCAIKLKKQNIPVLVIDKAKFPRNKLCGGMFTNKSYELFYDLLDGDVIINKAIVDESNTFSIFDKYSKVAKSKETNINFKIINREVFDNELVEYYKSIGGSIEENVFIKSISDKEVMLSNGECIGFDKLIISEGAVSRSRTLLGIKYNMLGFCLETEVDYENLKQAYKTKDISILFNIIEYGYAWIFPYNNKCKIGFGNRYNKKIDYKKKFIDFIQNVSNAQIERISIKGSFIPFGDTLDYKNDNIYLIGDSGGFVDPIYGEGIYFAGKTGSLLADCIINNLDYYNEVKKLKSIIYGGYKKQKLLFNKTISKLFFAIIKNKSNFLKFYADNMIQQYNYDYSDLIKLGVDYEKHKNMVD